MSRTCGCAIWTLESTEFLRPFIALQLSLQKLTTFDHGICLELKHSSSALYKFSPEPMLTIGMSKKKVFTSFMSLWYVLTSITKHLSDPLSLLSSHIMEKCCDLHISTTIFSRLGAMDCFKIWVHFVRPHANLLAISLSGNIFGASLLKWSATRNGILCSAIKLLNRVSATVTRFDVLFVVTKLEILLVRLVDSVAFVCCKDVLCRFTS